jgi:L-ribulokinase
VYANVFGVPVLVPERPITGLGSAIFAFRAAGTFPTIEEAQRALCPPYRVIEPDPDQRRTYDRLYPMYRDLYFGFGSSDAGAVEIGRALPELRRIAAEARA